MLEVTLLGTGGTMPLKNRWLSACLIKHMGHSVLIDCGEGTQIAQINSSLLTLSVSRTSTLTISQACPDFCFP